MSEFGFRSLNESENEQPNSITDKLRQMPQSQPRSVNIPEMDAVANQRGFSSREPGTVTAPINPALKRVSSAKRSRRVIPQSGPKKQLTIRMERDEYYRFRAHADREKVTFEAALNKLMDDAHVPYSTPEELERYKQEEE